MILHNPYILTLPEVGGAKDDIIPKNVQQFYISCAARDKLVHILALLKLELVQKKVLIFTNSIDMSFRLKLFFEQFGIKSAVLNAELPQSSRLHILEEFNAGLFDYLIATDESQSEGKEQVDDQNGCEQKKSKEHRKHKLDAEFGVVRGIDFKNVHTCLLHKRSRSTSLFFRCSGEQQQQQWSLARSSTESEYKALACRCSCRIDMDSIADV